MELLSKCLEDLAASDKSLEKILKKIKQEYQGIFEHVSAKDATEAAIQEPKRDLGEVVSELEGQIKKQKEKLLLFEN